MPTYTYRCATCGEETDVLQTMREYATAPIRPTCHGTMERRLSVVPGMAGLANALAGDRHYDGLRATDGSDISSRTKHREYMKSKGLTMADDFKGTWGAAAKEREALRSGTFQDKGLRETIAKELYTKTA